MATPSTVFHVDGVDVVMTNPDKVYFPAAGVTKRQLADYYLAVAEGALRGVRNRPLVLRRFVHGIDGEPFFQKRAPPKLPAYIRTARFSYPSGGVADECVIDGAVALPWLVNLGCIELHAHPVRADDLEHPDELRVDLDPVAGVAWGTVLEVAATVRAVLEDHGLVGWPKTSGSRGVHIWVRIARTPTQRWPFAEVRRAGLALAREVERRAPGIATSVWDKTERHGVLVDYNQNAKDRTTAAAYSVRPTPDARVSMPLSWADLAACDAAQFTLLTVPALYAKNGDAHANIDDAPGDITKLLALADTLDVPKAKERSARKLPRAAGKEPGVVVKMPTGRDKPKPGVLVVSRAKHKPEALAGLERFKAAHPDVAARLTAEDVIVDAMRGRSSAWYRVRINLKNVPAEERPAQGTPDPDYDPRTEYAGLLDDDGDKS